MGKGALKKTIAICCSITMLATSISGAGVIVSGVSANVRATGDFFDIRKKSLASELMIGEKHGLTEKTVCQQEQHI